MDDENFVSFYTIDYCDSELGDTCNSTRISSSFFKEGEYKHVFDISSSCQHFINITMFATNPLGRGTPSRLNVKCHNDFVKVTFDSKNRHLKCTFLINQLVVNDSLRVCTIQYGRKCETLPNRFSSQTDENSVTMILHSDYTKNCFKLIAENGPTKVIVVGELSLLGEKTPIYSLLLFDHQGHAGKNQIATMLATGMIVMVIIGTFVILCARKKVRVYII